MHLVTPNPVYVSVTPRPCHRSEVAGDRVEAPERHVDLSRCGTRVANSLASYSGGSCLYNDLAGPVEDLRGICCMEACCWISRTWETQVGMVVVCIATRVYL